MLEEPVSEASAKVRELVEDAAENARNWCDCSSRFLNFSWLHNLLQV